MGDQARDELGRFAEGSGGMETSFSKDMGSDVRDFSFPTRGSDKFAKGAKKFGAVKMFSQADGSMLVQVDTSKSRPKAPVYAAARAIKAQSDSLKARRKSGNVTAFESRMFMPASTKRRKF